MTEPNFLGGLDVMVGVALSEAARKLEEFLASPSRRGTPTGARTEGKAFERLAREWWQSVAEELQKRGADIQHVRVANRLYNSLHRGRRTVYVPAGRPDMKAYSDNSVVITQSHPKWRWFDTTFKVSDIVATFPGVWEAIQRYAPDSGSFAGRNYPRMYEGATISFDDTVVFEDDGALTQKWLLEYKTAKPNSARQIEGNAHERLSFQMLSYLEIASRFPVCRFLVFANGAFSLYKNKYHVCFHIQADRLRVYSFFDMLFLSTKRQYLKIFTEVSRWLLGDP